MYPKNCQLASVQDTFTPQDGTDTDLADLASHSATCHFATAKIPASQLGKDGGTDEIDRFLEVINRERTWIKWGHGRFALIQRTTTGYEVRPTRLAIPQADVDAGLASEAERSRSREFTGEVFDLPWLLRLSKRQEQKGIFWIPAATDAELPLKREIQRTDVISCEIDLAPTHEQLERFEWFKKITGLKYGLMLSSGSKSIHVHIFLNESVGFDQADRLRKLFILCLLGDPAIANRTQPMRAPGFFRQAEGNYQQLLSSSTQRYSWADIEDGLEIAYAALGWAFPATLSNELWRDCLPLLKERKDAEGNGLPVVANEQRQAIGTLLKQDGNGHYAQQAKARQERADASRLHRAQLELSGQFDLLGAVQGIDAQLSPDQAFNGTDHQWAYAGSDKARGYCHWHGSTSNSAWISRTERGWAYHCPTCTDNKPLGGFAYWLAERNGVGAAFPTGKAWADAATEYVQAHGVPVPAWKPAVSAVVEISPRQGGLEAIKPKKTADEIAQMAGYFRAKNPGFYGLTCARTIVNERYITLTLPDPSSALVVSSDVSTGKTEGFKQLKAQFYERHPGGYFDMQGYRNALLKQTAGRIGGNHIRDLECIGTQYAQLQIDDARELLYCIDSLNRRAPALMRALAAGKPVCIGLDEADSIVRHTASGGTLNRRHAEIWAMWCDLLKAVIAGGGYILALEADLSQIAVDALAEISGNPSIVAIENQHRPHAGRKVINHIALNTEGDSTDSPLGKIFHIDVLAAAQRGPVFAGTDAQAQGKVLEMAARAKGLKVLRIDSQTHDCPEVQAFLRNPDAAIQLHQYDLVIVTTSAESGLSVSDGYFSAVYLYGSHLENRALKQLSARVRGMCPLHLYIRSRAIATSEDPDSFTPEGVLKAHQKNQQDSALSAEVTAHFSADALMQAGKNLARAEAESLHKWQATYTARKNLSGAFLRANVLALFEATGHDISHQTTTTDELSESDIEDWKAAREGVREQETAEYKAQPLDKDSQWAVHILGSNSCSYLESVQAQKILDNDRWPGLPLNDETFIKEQIIKGRRNALKAHTFGWMCDHPKIAQLLDLKSWKAQLEAPFMVLSAIRKESAKIKVLAQSALHDIAKLKVFAEDYPLAVQVGNWARARKDILNRLFRLTIRDSHTNIQIINKLLKKIGYVAKSGKQLGSDGNRSYEWTAEPMAYQAEVWASLETKWAEALGSETIEIGEVQTSRSQLVNTEIFNIRVDCADGLSAAGQGARVPSPIPLSEVAQLALAHLMINYGTYASFQAYLEGLGTSARELLIDSLPSASLARFANISA